MAVNTQDFLKRAVDSTRYGVGNWMDVVSYVPKSLGLGFQEDKGRSEAVAGRPTFLSGYSMAKASASDGNYLSQPASNPWEDSVTNQSLMPGGQSTIPGSTTKDSGNGGGGGGGGGGGDSRLEQLAKMDRNPVQEEEYQKLLQQIRDAEYNSYEAQLAREESRFNRNRESLLSSLDWAGKERDSALGYMDTQLENVRGNIDTQKKRSQQSSEDEISRAGAAAQNTQRQNRNILRALGILNSIAAGELLSKPLTQFDQQKAMIVQAGRQRLEELDNFLNEKMAEANYQKGQLQQQYAKLAEGIQRDLRFNDEDRLNAMREANAAYQSRLNAINQQALNYKQQVEDQARNFAMQMAQLNNYNAPTANLDAILGSVYNPQQDPGRQTVSLYGQPKREDEEDLLSRI